jgi:hypothetical protein
MEFSQPITWLALVSTVGLAIVSLLIVRRLPELENLRQGKDQQPLECPNCVARGVPELEEAPQ